jgi:4-oxalomesaconate hydratase
MVVPPGGAYHARVPEGPAPAGSLLVVGAHAADFVWRAAGTVALHTAAGWRATVVALSYGEHGESGDLWRQPGQSVENVKRVRHEECARAAAAIGADLVPFDLGDYPLEVPDGALARLVEVMREVRPEVIVTHAPVDPFNPDHPVAFALADRARKLAMGAAGVAGAFATIPPPRLYLFEPHHPEQCGFRPDTFVDYSPVAGRKEAAMAAMAAQSYLRDHYRQRGEQRAVQARYFGAGPDTRYVEAFQLTTPRMSALL